ncbi:uncharacterized protein [Aristolochia californica]|uniref:uncharacterized protein n=1 Tax=Aristolochia californica TaxID=171875 RepID=UPI0035DC5186
MGIKPVHLFIFILGCCKFLCEPHYDAALGRSISVSFMAFPALETNGCRTNMFVSFIYKAPVETFQGVKLHWQTLINSIDDEQLSSLGSKFGLITSRKVFTVHLILVLRGLYAIIIMIEISAPSLAVSLSSGDLPAQAGSLAPSLEESGNALPTIGLPILAHVGKAPMDLLISATSIKVEKIFKEADRETDAE